ADPRGEHGLARAGTYRHLPGGGNCPVGGLARPPTPVPGTPRSVELEFEIGLGRTCRGCLDLGFFFLEALSLHADLVLAGVDVLEAVAPRSRGLDLLHHAPLIVDQLDL